MMDPGECPIPPDKRPTIDEEHTAALIGKGVVRSWVARTDDPNLETFVTLAEASAWSSTRGFSN